MKAIAVLTVLAAHALLSPEPTAQNADLEPTIERLYKDLGNYDISHSPVSLTGALRWTNSGDSVVDVRQIVPSCGCIDAKADCTSVPPGESISISYGLELAAVGERTEFIRVVFGNDHVVEFNVRYSAHRQRELLCYCVPDSEAPNRDVTLVLWYVIGQGVDEVAEPSFAIDRGSLLSRTEWMLVEAFDAARQRPARFVAIARIRRQADASANAIAIDITVDSITTSLSVHEQSE